MINDAFGAYGEKGQIHDELPPHYDEAISNNPKNFEPSSQFQSSTGAINDEDNDESMKKCKVVTIIVLALIIIIEIGVIIWLLTQSQPSNNNQTVSPDTCSSSPCLNNGVCADYSTYYLCLCPAGFIGVNCETDVDDCVSQPCLNKGTCIDHVDMYQCNCPSGYLGHDCQYYVGGCKSNPCRNGGSCLQQVNSYFCNCPASHTGPLCQTPLNFCTGNRCLNSGVCINKGASYQCNCTAGTVGTYCQIDTRACLSHPCLNNGTCVAQANNYTCICPVGFAGYHCEQDNTNACISRPCLNGGSCIRFMDTFSCKCAVGYTGIICESVKDNCLNLPCRNGGTCSNALGNFTCTCAAGYTDKNCLSIIDNCLSNPCLNTGQCINSLNSYYCVCSGFYYGTICQTQTSVSATATYGGIITTSKSWFNDYLIFLTNGAVTGMTIWLDTVQCVCVTGILTRYGYKARSAMQGDRIGTAYSFELSPYEFITSVEVGYNTISSASGIICYLAFHSPVKSYGPFNAGCSPSASFDLVNGFAFMAGQSGATNISMLLFYYYNTTQLLSPLGSTTGATQFNEYNLYLTYGPVTGISLWIGSKINGILSTYGSNVMAPMRGSQTGTLIIISLATGEVINNVIIGWGTTICTIKIVTTTTSYGTYSASSCTVTTTTSTTGRLLWFQGSYTASYVYTLGFGYSGY